MGKLAKKYELEFLSINLRSLEIDDVIVFCLRDGSEDDIFFLNLVGVNFLYF